MDMESYFIKTEGIMKGNGNMIKWMDLQNYIINQVKWHTKDIGYKINFMAKEKFLMIIKCN